MKKTKKILVIALAFCFFISLLTMVEAAAKDVVITEKYSEDKDKLIFTVRFKNDSVLLGDVNGDGYVTFEDSEKITGALLGNSEQLTDRQSLAADIKDRGIQNEETGVTVDATDALELQKITQEIEMENYLGISLIGTLANSSTMSIAPEDEKSTVYYVTVDLPANPVGTIGVKMLPGAVGYADGSCNTEAIERLIRISNLSNYDNSITLSEGVKSDNKITFNVNIPEGTGLRGDANNDGQLDTVANSTDSYLMQQYTIQLRDDGSINTCLADDNLDGIVDILDVLAVQKKAKEFVPVKLSGTLAENARAQLIRNDDGEFNVVVTIPENTTEGTIGVTLPGATLVTTEKKVNKELSKTFTLSSNEQPGDGDGNGNGTGSGNNNGTGDGNGTGNGSNNGAGEQDKIALKVVDKKEEKQKDGKVKVTVTVNKELDSDKLPKGWELSKDKKSISKVMKAGATEKIELVAVDGTKLDYTVKVTANKGGEKLPTILPQAGLGTTLVFVAVVVAGIALISLKKYRDYKDIK